MFPEINDFISDINSGRFGTEYHAILALYGGTVLFPGEREPVKVKDVYFRGPDEEGCIIHLFRRSEDTLADLGFVHIAKDGSISDFVVGDDCRDVWSKLASIYFRESEFSSISEKTPEIARKTDLDEKEGGEVQGGESS